MIYALGGVSGANFNPAVSTTLALCKYLSWGDFGPSVASQLAGGLAAGVCYTSLTGKGVPLAPGTGHSMSSVAVAETALGGVSGANFNPAVTTTLALCKYLPMGDVGPYIGSQLAGGLAAGVASSMLTGKGVPLAPGAGHSM